MIQASPVSKKMSLSSSIKFFILLLFISIPLLAEIKLQLDENFQFVGKDAYDNVFSIDGLDEILKSHIQQLLLDSYGSELLEVRLKDMDQENLSEQKYI